MASQLEAPTAEVPPVANPDVADPPSTKQTVDPWNVSGEVGEDGKLKAIDYKKLVEEFGTKLIDQEILTRFEKVTGHKPHRFLRRQIVFSQRDLELILDRHEKGEPFFLYTGRGPSSDSMHIGHTQIFDFCKWLQDVFDVPLIIMLTDDEKFLFSEKRTVEEVIGYSHDNCKDIISIGFDPEKTFIFSDYEYMGGAFYRNITRFAKLVSYNVAKAVFGFNESSNIGKIHFASIQGSTSFATSFPHIFGENETETAKIPCLIPCAIDQDPYFRLTRDCAQRLKYAKPSLIHSRFLDALQGPGSKMSASIDTSAIFMKDTPNQIKNKINKYAFSGGQETAEQQRELGGNPDVDVAYQYLQFFMEDDEELAKLGQEYREGKLLTGELKAICIKHLQEYVAAFQERRTKATDDVVKQFMSVRPLKWGGNSKIERIVPVSSDQAESVGDGKISKNQLKKLEKERQIAARKAAKAAEKQAS
ncbi:putative tryptophanyl-tRNA synthetase [Rosellinia necatrix]|uniref:Tryptophan--tRNA ligase, cytoplasmic n=1 Tax=Rosellinia necatrix TaxID=77044 RepID=A0A1S7UKY5_ROSNE|nr:putative tryptophanyl-tRNA synthetase [Rosellinia necatrix]